MNNNTFNQDDSDHTQIYPMPGGSREDIAEMLRKEREQRPITQTADPDATIFQVGFNSPSIKKPIPSAPASANNKLIDAASPLLVLTARISNTIDAQDTHQLKQQITKEIDQFQRQAQEEDIDHNTIQDASYVLCTVLDEAVLNTPWGQQSDWSINTLLSTHFQDVTGGTVFFEKLKQIGNRPAQSIQLLKLMYYCLSLGFQGRYRHEQNPIGKLNFIKADTADKIREVENIENNEHLSPHWLGVSGLNSAMKNSIPAWLIGAMTAMLLLAIFSTFFFLLSNGTNKVITAFEAISFNKAVASAEPIFTPKEDPIPSLTNDGSMEIDENSDKTSIRISGDLLFKSGSASLSEALLPTLSILGEELNSRPGQIEITGHSDNVPITSTRLKSLYPAGNYDLSQARADNVGLVLNKYLEDSSRMSTRGVGADSPLADNSSAEGRKKNRRVEIVIFH